MKITLVASVLCSVIAQPVLAGQLPETACSQLQGIRTMVEKCRSGYWPKYSAFRQCYASRWAVMQPYMVLGLWTFNPADVTAAYNDAVMQECGGYHSNTADELRICFNDETLSDAQIADCALNAFH